MNNKKVGFTLAEVLITLGIIGVVAAMTIPSLMTNMKGLRYRVMLKKSVSTISQAAKMNKARYDWDFGDINIPCHGTDFHKHHPETHMSICAIFNGNITGGLGFRYGSELVNNYGYKYNSGNSPNIGGMGAYGVFQMADGTLVGFQSYSIANKGCALPIGQKAIDANLPGCRGFIDVNGMDLPNKEVKCSVGTTSRDLEQSCIVNSKDMTDMYPILYHDQIIEPQTNATKYVLQTAK